MDKKKRIIILSAAIFLMALGITVLFIAGSLQDTVDEEYALTVVIIGLSSFVFFGIALFLLLKNYNNIVSSEMNEKAEKMLNEENFFSRISLDENPQTLEERFSKAGFKLQQNYLHKRQFSFAKNYINYYVVIVREENIISYLEAFLKNDDLFQNRPRFNINKVCYVFFFNSNINNEELDTLKNVIINQDVTQGLPVNFDTLLPIVYDTVNQEYIVKIFKGKVSLKLLRIAYRKFYKMIGFVK